MPTWVSGPDGLRINDLDDYPCTAPGHELLACILLMRMGPAGREGSGIGAGNEIRTRDPDLGKVVLYQLSYSRLIKGAYSTA